MSATTEKTPHAEALAIATHLEAALTPYCERVLIAGSIRRGSELVGDIELVVTPKWETSEDMFGNPGEGIDLLTRALDGIEGISPAAIARNGAKYKTRFYTPFPGSAGMKVDIFNADPQNWGYIATLRTGGADFSKWIVTERSHGGAKPKGMTFKDGYIRDMRGQLVAVPTEEAFFEAIDCRFVPIEERGSAPTPAEARRYYIL